MENLKREGKVDFQQVMEDLWASRSPVERRTDADKRLRLCTAYFKRGGKERRLIKERRKLEERRDGWLRVGKWRSEAVFDEQEP